ncbi:MAG: hypothetical protein MUO85_02050, partial [candidate division Zixibacteria bacterium]|nr:hypothetical protein [candidate division Zixibacteria bacterium]
AAPPFMWGTFTPCSMPVYPGAFTTSPSLDIDAIFLDKEWISLYLIFLWFYDNKLVSTCHL